MNSLKIIADSTSDLDPALTGGLGPEILPLVITIDDKSYLDREEIGVDRVYAAMRAGVLPKTSQIPYERAYDTFKSCFENGDDFIYIAFSSRMSGCYSLACMIAVTHADDEPDARILERLIREKLPDCRTTLCHIGGVLGVHIGLKGIGAFCLNQKPDGYALV